MSPFAYRLFSAKIILLTPPLAPFKGIVMQKSCWGFADEFKLSMLVFPFGFLYFLNTRLGYFSILFT